MFPSISDLCPVIIQFHPLPPQWRRCQKAHVKHPVPSITATMARKAHVNHPVPATMEEIPERHTWAGQTMVSLDILCVSIDLRVYFLCPVIIQFHPLPPQWRRCQKDTHEASSSIHYCHNGGKAHVKSIQFHPLLPQWRRCLKGTRWPVKLW